MSGMWRAAKNINWFFTTHMIGVAIFALMIGAFNEPIRVEVEYWVSRATKFSAWKSYDEAVAELGPLEDASRTDIEQGYQNVLEKLKIAAEGGISQAMLEYGELLCLGRQGFFAADKATGRFWIERAAIAGHPRARVVACQKRCG